MNSEKEILKNKAFKKFVRYKEGAELYSMGITNFQKIAKEAKAIYKVGNIVLVNTNILDDYLEMYKLP